MVWRQWINAQVYDRFVREQQIYGWLNRELVGLAHVAGASRVLDLACGTGATTLACLGLLDMEAEVVGLDASPEMVEVARTNVLDARASFRVAAAAAIDPLHDGTFERAVCNAAFWQFPAAGAVLAALSTVLDAEALFVFNVPAERVLGESSPIHPFQMALAHEIERATGRAFTAVPTATDPAQIRLLAAENGFRLESVERRVYHGHQRELMELMTIPAMIQPLTDGLPDERRAELLDRAMERSDPELEVDVPWVYFTLQRTA